MNRIYFTQTALQPKYDPEVKGCKRQNLFFKYDTNIQILRKSNVYVIEDKKMRRNFVNHFANRNHSSLNWRECAADEKLQQIFNTDDVRRYSLPVIKKAANCSFLYDGHQQSASLKGLSYSDQGE